MAQNPSALATVQGAVNDVDKWINIADKGISLLGRFDSILGKIQGIQANRARQAAPQQQHPVQDAIIMPEMGRVNADPPQQPPVQEPAAEAMNTLVNVNELKSAVPGGIQLPQLLQVMDMIDKLQPGITVRDLHDSIGRNPDQVARLIAAYTGTMKK